MGFLFFDQFAQSSYSFDFVGPFRLKANPAAGSDCRRQKSQNRFCINLHFFVDYVNIRPVFLRRPHKVRSGFGIRSQSIADLRIFQIQPETASFDLTALLLYGKEP